MRHMEENGFTKRQIIIIIFGVLFTACSFCLYFLLNINWLNIVCGIICLLYVIFLMYFELYDKEEFTQKQRFLYPTVLVAVFYGAVIALIAIINPLGKFCLDYILWTLFCGPSIIPGIFLLMLFIGNIG